VMIEYLNDSFKSEECHTYKLYVGIEK
jgi:hypothetical protein